MNENEGVRIEEIRYCLLCRRKSGTVVQWPCEIACLVRMGTLGSPKALVSLLLGITSDMCRAGRADHPGFADNCEECSLELGGQQPHQAGRHTCRRLAQGVSPPAAGSGVGFGFPGCGTRAVLAREGRRGVCNGGQRDRLCCMLDVMDHIFVALGNWGFMRYPKYRLSWPNPQPNSDDAGRPYYQYTIHQNVGAPRSALAGLRKSINASILGPGNKGWVEHCVRDRGSSSFLDISCELVG